MRTRFGVLVELDDGNVVYEVGLIVKRLNRQRHSRPHKALEFSETEVEQVREIVESAVPFKDAVVKVDKSLG